MFQYVKCRNENQQPLLNWMTAVDVSSSEIKPSATIKNLCVLLDQHHSVVQPTSRQCLQIVLGPHTSSRHVLQHVRDSHLDDVAQSVAVSIVTSRLDYCNALYARMSPANFNNLQRVQSIPVRVLLRRHKYDNITPSLFTDCLWDNELLSNLQHWLIVCYIPVNLIIVKLPAYLSARVQLAIFWSKTVYVSRTRIVTASRGFKHSAVSVWNSLPFDIRNSDSVFSFRP